MQVMHRVTTSFCLSLVNVMDRLTNDYMHPVEGFCLAILVFILAEIGDFLCRSVAVVSVNPLVPVPQSLHPTATRFDEILKLDLRGSCAERCADKQAKTRRGVA